jgi:hypothetical protein
LVQGRADPQREILDVESVAGHLPPEGGMLELCADSIAIIPSCRPCSE